MIVLCSGGFDPLHVGHLRLLEAAARIGPVFVALNSDAWLIDKKGYAFMRWPDRRKILDALVCVAGVYPVDDRDGTVCSTLRAAQPNYFANGGDQMVANPAEFAVCKELGIKQIFNVGGGKIASSSELVKAIR